MIEKVFKLKANGTNIRTEIVAGFTTFITMSYVVVLNPNILTNYDTGSSLWNAVFMATCIASFLGTFCMAVLANKPFVMAPGMGLNSFFASIIISIVAATGLSYTEAFQSGLCIIFIEGIIFIILSLINVREKIVDAIPLPVRLGITPAIGMMLINIGFGSNATVEGNNGEKYYVLRDLLGALTTGNAQKVMGDAFGYVILDAVAMLVGLFAIIYFSHKGKKAAVLYGIIVSAVLYWACQFFCLNENPFAGIGKFSIKPPFGDFAEVTLFKMNFSNLFSIGYVTVIILIVSFCMIDMFDTIGVLMGTASRANMLDENGKFPKMKEALLSDAIGTFVGSLSGTSTVTTYVESASGVEAGGRTGLSALISAILFLLCIFISPIIGVIPPAATSAALIYVAILMISDIRKIDLGNISSSAPTALMLIAMPITGSVGYGIGLGIISYTVISLLTGKRKDISALTYVLTVLFLIKFFAPI